MSLTITVLLLVVMLAAIGFMTYWSLVASWRNLDASLRGRLGPGENIIFRAIATFMKGRFPRLVFNMKHGLVLVTNQRILFAQPIFLPFVPIGRSFTQVPLDAIERVETEVGAVAIEADGERLTFVPAKSKLWPFLRGSLAEELAAAINMRRAVGA